MRYEIPSFLRRLGRDQNGAVAIIVALLTIMFFGFAAISVDVGYLFLVKANLQASANAAALAGGQNIPSGTAVATAISYGAQSGQKNVFSAQTVTTTPTLSCLTTLVNWFGPNQGIPCLTYGNQAAANAIVVTQTAVVPTIFGRVLGISTVTVSAIATASSKGGSAPPLNVITILDTTASMNNADSNCTVPGISHPTKLNCALYGAQVLLGILSPSADPVGLMVFPGLTNASQVSKEYDCSSGTQPSIVNYTTAANAVYGIISSSTDYRTSASATSLNSSSNLTKAVSMPGVAGSSCSGLSAVGGFGTYYASVITAAQTALTASHQPGQQNVIIFLGDGGVSGSTNAGNVGTGRSVPPNSNNPAAVNQCHAAIAAAQAATAAKTWVYSIAYGATSTSCGDDTPSISECSTMQQLASDSSKFYSDNPSGCASVNTIAALSSIYQNIGLSLLNSRLIPNGTT